MLENRLLEVIIIALVVLVLFGAKRLPDTARSLGRSMRILKAETRAGRDEAAPEQAPQSAQSAQQPVLLTAEPAKLHDTRTTTAESTTAGTVK